MWGSQRAVLCASMVFPLNMRRERWICPDVRRGRRKTTRSLELEHNAAGRHGGLSTGMDCGRRERKTVANWPDSRRVYQTQGCRACVMRTCIQRVYKHASPRCTRYAPEPTSLNVAASNDNSWARTPKDSRWNARAANVRGPPPAFSSAPVERSRGRQCGARGRASAGVGAENLRAIRGALERGRLRPRAAGSPGGNLPGGQRPHGAVGRSRASSATARMTHGARDISGHTARPFPPKSTTAQPRSVPAALHCRRALPSSTAGNAVGPPAPLARRRARRRAVVRADTVPAGVRTTARHCAGSGGAPRRRAAGPRTQSPQSSRRARGRPCPAGNIGHP